MMVLNEVTPGGVQRREVWPDDVAVVSTLSKGGGSEITTIDGKRFDVVEDVAEVFALLEESDGAWGE